MYIKDSYTKTDHGDQQSRRGKGRGDSSRGHRQGKLQFVPLIILVVDLLMLRVERKPSQEPDETVVLKDLPKSLESDRKNIFYIRILR